LTTLPPPGTLVPATTLAATTVPHVPFTLTADGLLRYELTLAPPPVRELMTSAVTDAPRFDMAIHRIRRVFRTIVPTAKSSVIGSD